ncbi:hypothetical protein Slin15195_G018690 [Septoria linicola]|uniref:Glycine zipper 2TM domain-containing protein n=1 Tax=Septoria linicola TaxID=215465 RepID=A0A9Q9ALB7_9PEZI|nr:hypothetical protein Slin14017_G018770 [Septoria linicola]USW48550.1 hypothetical protein Slin15195_G018690 [Septoria linicola]
MEKLILKGVMWGADKVPDEWFDRIPGGYYKAKEKQVEQELEHEKKKNADMKKRRTRRYSDDEYEEDDDRDSRGGGRDDRDAGYRSEGHKSRRSEPKKSHDGADDDFDEINNRPRRKRSKGRRGGDNDKYGKDDGHHRSSRRSRHNGVEYGDGALPPAEQPPPSVTYTDPMAGAAAMGGAAAAASAFQQNGAYGSPLPSTGAYGSPPPMNGAYASPQPSSGAYGSPQPFPPQPNVPGSINSFMHAPNQPPAQSTSTLRGGMSTGYVPYAHIYGGPIHPPSSQSGYPPPQSDVGSVQPTYMNQVAARKVAQPPAHYQQNPYAQEAAPGTQPGYMPNPYPQQDRDRDEKSRGGYESDDTARDSRCHRRRARKSRRDRTPSEDSDSDDSRDDRDRRRRSRPPPRDKAAPPAAPQSKSAVSGTFDTSQRGLGYSAIGALAGGLIGSEFGKGTMSRAVATAVGAIAANAFQARERRKEEAREKEYHLRKAGYYSD